MLGEQLLASLLGRDPELLRGLVCVGSPRHCLESCPGTGTRAASACACGRWETSDASSSGSRAKSLPGSSVADLGREHRLAAESRSVDAQRSIY
jgi:hypothetical protein